MKFILHCRALASLICCLVTSPLMGQQTFENVTADMGLEGLSGAVAAWGDFNNDDWTDLYVAGQLWQNQGGKNFVLVNDTPLRGAGIWADFNNDGYLDLFSWESGGAVFLNEKGAGFKLVEGGLPELPMAVSLGATTGDFDNDGLVDIYVGGYEIWQKVTAYHDVILRNRGNGKFEEAWRSEGTLRQARGITAADYDRDGDLDIYVSNYRLAPNHLLRNNGQGQFEEVAGATKTDGDGDLGAWGHTIGSSWGDLDNDGWLDLFVGNFSHPPAYQDRPKFLRNQTGTEQVQFEDRSANAGLAWQESFASPALGDFDNDGNQDLFFTCVYSGDHSVLYRNAGNWAFQDVTSTAKVATAQTYQAAWADFDNDGDLDLVSGGKLFRNANPTGDWLKLRLHGGPKNSAAIGAQVRVFLGADRILTRQVTGATGQGNQNDLTLHFGLGGDAPEMLKADILWPGGKSEVVQLKKNQLTKLTCKD